MPDGSRLLSHTLPMASSLHYMQLLLLVSGLEWHWRDQQDFFIGADLNIYFSRQQLRSGESRGPDFFLVKNTEKRPRNSWVVWEEDGRYPNLIIELLSDSTAKADRTLKKVLYQDRFRTCEYFWFSPQSLEFAGFRLGSSGYEPIEPTPQGWRWSQELDLYLGIQDRQLRYFSPDGQLVPTPAEAAQQQIQLADQETQRADQETQRADQQTQRADQQTQRADQETQRADRLAAQLRALGMEPE
jgi:Uma2 family endonuclease